MTPAIHAENVRQIKTMYLTTELEGSGLHISVLLMVLFFNIRKEDRFLIEVLSIEMRIPGILELKKIN